MKKLKGLVIVPVVIGIAIGAVAGICGTVYYFKTHSGGLGDGKDTAIQVNENISVPEEIPETSETETASETESESETETEPVTEHGNYLVITITGNEYHYDHQICTLEDILSMLNHSEEISSVMLVNDKASKKAYDTLYTALQNQNISLIRSE